MLERRPLLWSRVFSVCLARFWADLMFATSSNPFVSGPNLGDLVPPGLEEPRIIRIRPGFVNGQERFAGPAGGDDGKSLIYGLISG
jgi:hypothetical protein